MEGFCSTTTFTLKWKVYLAVRMFLNVLTCCSFRFMSSLGEKSLAVHVVVVELV